MDNEAEKIIEEQIAKLPKEVITFISSASWDTDADEIGSLYNLSREELVAFKNELTLAIVGLTHPDEFSDVLAREVGLQGAVLEAVVKNVEEKIFTPIRPALIEFFEKEANEPASQEPEVMSDTEGIPTIVPVPEPPRTWEKEADIAPENLPTDEEGESLLPPIPLKFGPKGDVAPTHPFEEKMKKVFIAGQQSLDALTIEPTTQTSSTTQASKAPPIYHADPYREPIE